MAQPSAVAAEMVQIQATSRVLILDSAIKSVLWVSENCLECLSLSITQLKQQTVAEILGEPLYQALSNGFEQQQQYQLTTELQCKPDGNLIRLSVTAWRTDDFLILEFEPVAEQTEQPLLSKTNQWLNRLSQVSRSEAVTEVLVDAIAELSGFDRVCLHRFDAQFNSQVIAEHCKPGISSLAGLSFPASGMMLNFQKYLQQHNMISINDVNAEPVLLMAVHETSAAPEFEQRMGQCWMPPADYLQMLKNLKVASVMVIAIFQDDQLWGSINCHSFAATQLSATIRDVSFNLVQMATQRLFLLTSRENNAFQQRVMNSRQLLSDERNRLAEPAEMLADYGDSWLDLFSACGVALVYEDGIVRHGNLPSDAAINQLVNQLSAQRKACWASDALAVQFPDMTAEFDEYCGLLAISLPYDNDNPGYLLLFRPEEPTTVKWAVRPTHLSASDKSEVEKMSLWLENIQGKSQPWTLAERHAALDLGEDLAVVIAVHQISKLNQRFKETNYRLEQLAHTDSLTQIWNRYRMELAIDSEIAAAVRYGRSFSLLLFDIDHFKQINDNYGHELGDAVLAGIAWEVKTLLRASDYLGRWGGEEFIVLASSTEIEEASQLAERLCKYISALELETVGQVTVSIGVTQWQTGDHRRTLLERADNAMYQAKQAGRNRWIAASQS